MATANSKSSNVREEFIRIKSIDILKEHIGIYSRRIAEWQENGKKRGDSPPLFMLLGETGIGKSAILAEQLTNAGFKHIVQEGLPGFVQEPQDLLGMPVVRDGVTINVPPEPIARAAKLGTSGKTALILDELTQVQHQSIYTALQDLLDSYTASGLDLKNVTIFGISNPWTSKYVNSIEPGDQMKKRMKLFYMEFDHNAWMSWAATRKDLLPSLIEFFAKHKELMSDEKTNANTVTEAARSLKIYLGSDEGIQGILKGSESDIKRTVVLNELRISIGEEAGASYIGYLQSEYKEVPQPDKVFTEYAKGKTSILDKTLERGDAQKVLLVRFIRHFAEMQAEECKSADFESKCTAIRDILLDKRLYSDLIPTFSNRIGNVRNDPCRNLYAFLSRQSKDKDIFTRLHQ